MMGKVLVPAKIENLTDLLAVESGQLTPDKVRSVEVQNALIDTGAIGLSIPASLLAPLGLTFRRDRSVRTSAGVSVMRSFGPVRLTIQGRDCPIDVLEVPDGCPILVGQVPLEVMDWVVDPGRQRLIGNPEHGGEQMLEMF